MAKDIKFNIKLQIDGKEQIAVATTDTKEFAKQLGHVKKATIDLNSKVIVFNQYAEAARNAAESLRVLSGAMSGIIRTNMQLSQITGTTGREMLKLKGNAQVLADYMGSDLNEVLIAANSLAKGFGISVGHALDMIRTGFVSGGNANGEFLDILREYPRYFKEAGISAEEFIAITVNAAQQGIFSDKGVDAIKEANIRIREMTTATAAALDGIGISSVAVQQALQEGTTTTFDVMQQVAARLRELPASASVVGTAIADIFGGPGEDAGLEYIKTLGDITLNLNSVKEAAGDTADSMEKQIKRLQGISNVFKLFDLSGLYAWAQPAVKAIGELGLAFAAVSNAIPVLTGLGGTIKKLSLSFMTFIMRTKAAGAAALLMGQNAKRSAVLLRVFSGALKTGAYSATALKLALKGLMSATVIGAVFVALTSIIEAFANASGKAKAGAEELQEAEQEFINASAEAKVQIEEDIKKLKGLMDANADTAVAVQELNDKYGESFGYFQTAEQWYNTLISKSGDYIKMIGYEAQARVLASKKAELEIKREINRRKQEEVKKDISAQGPAPLLNRLLGINTWSEAELQALQRQDAEYTAADNALQNELNILRKKIKDLNVNAQLGDSGGLNSGIDISQMNLKQVREEMAKLNAELEINTDAGVAKNINARLKELEAREEALKRLNGLDANSATTGSPKDGYVPMKGSIDYLEAEMRRIYGEVTAAATEEEAEKLLKRYNETAEELRRKKVAIGLEPDEKETESYIESLERQIREKQKTLGGRLSVDARLKTTNDINDLQAQIDEEVKGKLTIPAEVEPSYIVQGSTADKRQSYDNAGRRINTIRQDYEIGIIGKEDALRQIADINDQLRRLGLNPIEVNFDADTSEVDKVTDKFSEGFQNVTSVWGGVRGIGSGVDSLTNALDENASAWQRLTGIVDGFLGIIEGLRNVIAIIKALTGVTEAAGDAALTGSAKEVAASAASTAAKNTETTANVAAAASGAMAAHSGIPFVGIALGLAAVAAIVAAMLSLPKFAKGGIVSGPTLAMVGEYAGASGNPEVIAPLDKLRGMLVQSNGTDPRKVVFEIKGRRLVGVLNKENDLYTRN